jgi:hypothetical protein
VACDRSVDFFRYPVSSTNKTDRHDIAEILLKVALNTITLNQLFYGIVGFYQVSWYCKPSSRDHHHNAPWLNCEISDPKPFIAIKK